VTTDEQALRASASDGDTEAARDLGWLLSLDGQAWMATQTEGEPLEAELWLRRAAESRPDDSTAAVLLANLNARLCELVRHSTEWPEASYDRERFRAQAGDWYDRALAIDPACAPAASGLVAVLAEDWLWHLEREYYASEEDRLRAGDAAGAEVLAVLAETAERAVALTPDDPVAMAALAEAAWRQGDDEVARGWYRTLLAADPRDETAAKRTSEPVTPRPDGFGFLVVRLDFLVTNSGDEVIERLVLSDPAQLGWALDRMPSLDDEVPIDFGELRVYPRDEVLATAADSDPLQWRMAELDGPRLPLGHPVRVGGETLHHGYSFIPPW